MRIRLAILLLLLTAFSAAAQPELHFKDGTAGRYPVLQIGKDQLRIGVGGDMSRRIPLTFVESIRFGDGCTSFFDEGKFQFDRLVRPALLENKSGDVLLEGVLELNREQAESLMGVSAWQEFSKYSKLRQVGGVTMMGGFILLAPYASKLVGQVFDGGGVTPVTAFKKMSTAGKCITAGGAGALMAGIALAVIGNKNCNRVVATYNDGLGLAYTF